MPCKCNETARKIHDGSLELGRIAQEAEVAGDKALATEAAAVSRALLFVSLFVGTKDERELNRLVTRYQLAEKNLPKVAEAQARRTQVSRDMCGNGD